MLTRSLYNTLPSIGPAGPVLFMCLSASQLLSSWIKAPQDLNRAYLSFLDWQGGIIKADRYFTRRETLPILRPCWLVHPNHNCEEHLVYFFADGLLRAARLYAPLHAMLTLMSKEKSVGYFMENMVRSCVFLAGYCSAAWYSACLVHRILPKVGVSRLSLMLHTWIAGLFVMLERPGRQVELALYCSTYALDSVYKFFKTTELGKTFRLPLRLIIVLSMSALAHCYYNQPSFIICWLCGIPRKQVEEKRNSLANDKA